MRTTPLTTLLWLLVLSSSFAAGQQAVAPLVERPVEFRRDLFEDPAYLRSLAVLAAAQTADHFSSVGQQFERNPVLRDPRSGGYHSTRGALLKVSTTAGMALFQRWAARQRPELRKPAIVANYVLAAWFCGMAVHNLRLR